MGAPNDILELLSAYRDGELPPSERTRVEAAMANDPSLRTRLADLDALSGAVRATLEQAADEVDFAGFADGVMAKITPYKPHLGERLRVYFSEMFEYRRFQLAFGTVAALAVVVGGPLLVARAVVAPGGDMARAPTLVSPSSPSVTVRSVKTEGAHEAELFEGQAASVIFLKSK